MQMNDSTASIFRTLIKSAAVVVIFIGWPKFGRPHVFNQTVIQPTEADDLVMRSVILELKAQQHSEQYVYFERFPDEDILTDEYAMLRETWEKDGKPDSISITVSSLATT